MIGDVSLLDGWRTGTRQGVVLICFDNDGTLEWGVICTSYTWDDFNAKVYFDSSRLYYLFGIFYQSCGLDIEMALWLKMTRLVSGTSKYAELVLTRPRQTVNQ